MISVVKFTAMLVFYVFASLLIAFRASFTSAAWIFYAFTILPLYIICILYCLNLYLSNHREKIKIKTSFLYSIPICQLLFIITSPAECYFWHQGRACYSFIQATLTNTRLDPPHWAAIELIFPISLLLYVLLSIVALLSARVESDIHSPRA
jgi:hypothetical protein